MNERYSAARWSFSWICSNEIKYVVATEFFMLGYLPLSTNADGSSRLTRFAPKNIPSNYAILSHTGRRMTKKSPLKTWWIMGDLKNWLQKAPILRRTSTERWITVLLDRQLLHLCLPTTRFMPPFLEASAARNGGVSRNFSFWNWRIFSPFMSRVTCEILVSDILTAIYKRRGLPISLYNLNTLFLIASLPFLQFFSFPRIKRS